jgi:hypothetical protein
MTKIDAAAYYREANDDTGGAVWRVKRTTWWIGTFWKFVMAPLCGCWVSLLLARVTPEGSFFLM